MFTGIIEATGEIAKTEAEGTNLHLWIKCGFSNELKVDQSVAHNGVCLTVVEIKDGLFKVTAISETLKLTNLSTLKAGDLINLERCMPANGRFDGHIVQGHVDGIATCTGIEEEHGSWLFTFKFNHPEFKNLVVHKGSITVNGISLTVADVTEHAFTVAIIPYTYQNTNLHEVKAGDKVNIEFDIIGKYVARQLSGRLSTVDGPQ